MKRKFNQFNWFISQIKTGKTAIIVAPDYVVIDWKTWKDMNKKEEKREIVFFDECSEISDDVWNMLETRLKQVNKSL